MVAIKTLSTVARGHAGEKNLRHAAKFVQVSDKDERANEKKQLNRARNAKQIHSFFSSVFILEKKRARKLCGFYYLTIWQFKPER